MSLIAFRFGIKMNQSCPHCKAPNSLFILPVIKLLKTEAIAYLNQSGGDSGDLDNWKTREAFSFFKRNEYAIGICHACGQATLFKNENILYPLSSGISPVECMPEDAKNAFRESQSILMLSPRAACAMLRVCVERMVNATDAKGGNLAEKIESLGLPQTLVKLATACRLVGNDAVHNNVIDLSVGSEEAKVVSEALSRFANRIAEELFGMANEADEWISKIDTARKTKKK